MIVHRSAGDVSDVLGTTATIKLSSADTNGRLAVVEHAVPRGAGPPPHIHEREDELIYVLSGTCEFVLDDPSVWLPATAGTWVHVPAGTIHTSRATSDTARLLSIYSPAGGEAFFREIDTVDQTDLSAVMALAARHGMSFPTPARAATGTTCASARDSLRAATDDHRFGYGSSTESPPL
jgi:quercetin dioxygenase-like cupin family protein